MKRLAAIVLLATACAPPAVESTTLTTISTTQTTTTTTTQTTTTTTTRSPSTTAAPVTTTPGRHVAFTSTLSLDVYGSDGPTVVLFHGGGWVGGSPEDIAPLAEAIADGGAVVFNAPYRLVFEGGGFPATLEDAACAVRYAAAHAADYGGDPTHLVVVGYSAGAHIAAVVALAGDTFDGDCLVDMNDTLPSRLIGIAGPYDIDALGPLMEPFFGVERDADPERWALGNPLTYLGRNQELVVRLIHGDEDRVVPVLFSQYFEDQLTDHGYDASLTLLPGIDHTDVADPSVSGELVTKSLGD